MSQELLGWGAHTRMNIRSSTRMRRAITTTAPYGPLLFLLFLKSIMLSSVHCFLVCGGLWLKSTPGSWYHLVIVQGSVSGLAPSIMKGIKSRPQHEPSLFLSLCYLFPHETTATGYGSFRSMWSLITMSYMLCTLTFLDTLPNLSSNAGSRDLLTKSYEKQPGVELKIFVTSDRVLKLSMMDGCVKIIFVPSQTAAAQLLWSQYCYIDCQSII